MKKIKAKLDYKTVFRYVLLFFAFTVLNKLEQTVYPYSLALASVSFTFGYSLFITPILFLSSFLVVGQIGYFASLSIAIVFLIIVNLIYKKTGANLRYETVLFTALSLVSFIILGNTQFHISLTKRVFVLVATSLLTFLCYIAGKAITFKGLKYKLGYEEFASLGIIVLLFGLGICNLISPYLWQGLSVLILLLVTFIYKKGACTLTALTLSISLAIYYGNLNYVALFLLYSLSAESLMPLSRYLAPLSIVVTDYVVFLIFGMYSEYLIENLLCVLLGGVTFAVIPTKMLVNIKNELNLFREKQINRVAINRNRVMLSNRLYELSNVFNEMADAFTSFKKVTMTESSIKTAMRKEVEQSICFTCDNKARCLTYGKERSAGLDTMIDVGFAKGKLSLIDLPKELGDKCVHPNNIIYALNKLLADYRSYLLERKNLESGRNMIASETAGISDILRGLALESGQMLKYQSQVERALNDTLLKNGYRVSELLVYGEENNITVGLILTMREFSLEQISSIISKVVGISMSVCDKTNISDDKCYLSFRKAPLFDAVFGVAGENKDGEKVSGDTHSITRISDDKFLIALSDGMGSGEIAQNVSSVSISLIESFYRAGMKSELILGTVNKLLSLNAEDSFTALDISVIDLNDCSADFIKYGSPYGFIVGENGIKIIEGNTLPLGILEELKPSVCQVKLNGGDMIVFVTDGISDAFGSSSEVIEFLRSSPAKNPQTLADNLLKRAIELSKGEKKDDMTVLAVRIFGKIS